MKIINGLEKDIVTLSVAPCIPRGIGVEIGKGCNHGCIYCFSACGGEQNNDRVVYYKNTAEVLEKFLTLHADQVRNVHLGYVTDFLQDAGEEVEQIRLEVLRVLQRFNVHVSCLSKGCPSPAVIDEINKMADRFTFMLDVGCGDKRWEKNVRSLEERIGASRALECDKGARMDPIIPGVNDSDEWMEHICQGLFFANITDIDTSFLFLTDEVGDATEKAFGEEALVVLHNNYYKTGCEEHLNGAVAWTGESVDMEDIRYKIDTIALVSPDVEYRKQTIERFQKIAEKYGITVRLCNCKNRSMKGFTGVCSDARALCRRKSADC